MKNTVLKLAVLSFVMLGLSVQAQKKKDEKKVELSVAEKKKALEAEKARLIKPYNPKENAEVELSKLIEKAQAENKNIIVQAGGNWCIWCLRFNQFVQDTPELKSFVDKHFLYYHLNWSPDNKNEALFEKYGNPGEKYGYPVFIILNKNGEMIHVQESSGFEEGKGYSVDKVKEFFEKWADASK
ncbi:thioredoxin family protein [Amniculibacterium sp. G2-70]|uniref:thioredoxin family protein n=1 Tax=Amniculibacterium sp. G2-70 TaxID=2767188 RepID=UPI0016541832|nr:thioredoxin family protein [Amniculibacterium sp. G2-70]